MPTLDVPTLRITSPAAFAAALPMLVGFTPEESLVVVFLNGDTVIVTMRTDLTVVGHELNDYVVSTAQRVRANGALIATCTGDPDEPRAHRALVTGLVAALTDAEVDVRDALSIVDGRYWSYICQDDRCCHPEGSVIPAEGAVTRADVVAGFRPRPELGPPQDVLDRAALDADPDTFIRATQAWEAIQQLSLIDPDRPDSPETQLLRARVLVWCQHVHVRDFVLCSIAGAQGGATSLVDALAQTALRSPLDLRPRMAGMAAALLAALEPARESPAACLADLAAGDSLAELVRQSISTAVPPAVLRDLFANGLPSVLDAIQASHQV